MVTATTRLTCSECATFIGDDDAFVVHPSRGATNHLRCDTTPAPCTHVGYDDDVDLESVEVRIDVNGETHILTAS